MLIANIDAANQFVKKHRDASRWVAAWIETTTRAEWLSIADVRRNYPSADGVTLAGGAVITVFNVKGNKYRLLTTIVYALGVVSIIEIMTHAVYDKQKWK